MDIILSADCNLKLRLCAQLVARLRTKRKCFHIAMQLHSASLQPNRDLRKKSHRKLHSRLSIMPFLRLPKHSSIKEKDDRLLPFSQTPSTPSLAPSATTSAINHQEPYNDITQSNDDPPKPNIPPETDNTSQTTPNNPPFTRPTTPPQGSNHNPWSSYHNLSPEHPVFRYPDDVREKMYAKGVGQ